MDKTPWREPYTGPLPTIGTGPTDSAGAVTSAATCGDMIAVRPEGRGGVTLACTQPVNHREKHRHTGTAEGYPLVEHTALIPITVEWD